MTRYQWREKVNGPLSSYNLEAYFPETDLGWKPMGTFLYLRDAQDKGEKLLAEGHVTQVRVSTVPHRVYSATRDDGR